MSGKLTEPGGGGMQLTFKPLVKRSKADLVACANGQTPTSTKRVLGRA